MKGIALAAGLALLVPFGASAQTADQLVKGATDTSNVLNYGMGYNLQRFSPLTQINKDTVKNLVPLWNYSLADDRSEELQPIVYQGVIYITSNSATMAVDVKTGKQIWKTKVEYPPETPRIVCCGIINRGVAILDGKLFRTTLDANVIALDAKTGKELWRQKAADIKEGYSMTMAPLVADGVVLTGVSGAEFGTRDFIDGWDPADGKHLWRTYTVPSPDEPGGDTWKGDTWKFGGGSTWITGSYDPELNTVYWGVGNPGPFNAAGRPGDNLYTCSVLALDAKTGKIKWHFQFSPNNPFDYDSVAEMVLADINVEGKPTKVLMDANRNGFFYVLDRTNGKLLAANPYVKVNWASSIDMKTGRPVETDITKDAREGKKVMVYPSILGGKNWEPMSFNPQTGLAYANTLAFGGHYKTEPAEYKAGEWYVGMDLTDVWEWGTGPRGHLSGDRSHDRQVQVGSAERYPALLRRVVDGGRRRVLRPVDRRVRGVRRGRRQEALAVPDRIRHRRTAGDMAAGRRAVRCRHQRLWRRLLAVLRRRTSRQYTDRRIAVGVRGEETAIGACE